MLPRATDVGTAGSDSRSEGMRKKEEHSRHVVVGAISPWCAPSTPGFRAFVAEG